MAKTQAVLTLRRKRWITLPAYFWTDEWQRGEREAQDDIRRGRVKRFRSAKALVADLKR
jgi:hypothetical protein